MLVRTACRQHSRSPLVLGTAAGREGVSFPRSVLELIKIVSPQLNQLESRDLNPMNLPNRSSQNPASIAPKLRGISSNRLLLSALPPGFEVKMVNVCTNRFAIITDTF